jgi:AcrR family transcriptional regulator
MGGLWMTDTRENILHAALRLFARDGYEAASVSLIASELGITKGALYKHYKNKRDIFDSIVERMHQIDAERAKKYQVPEETFDKSPLAYRNTGLDKIKDFIEAQFQFWIEDEFAGNFRKMLTLEQYRNPEIEDLYQKCLGSGPVSYIEDLFREMMDQGILIKANPRVLALEFYGPFYLLLSISDTMSDKKEAARLLTAQIDGFVERYAVHLK